MVMIERYVTAALLVVAATLYAPSAFALKLKPGLWQDTETGTSNGKPVPPKVSTDCLSPEEAADPVKAALAGMKDMLSGQCSKHEIKQSGNQIVFNMNCGNPKQMIMEMSVVMTLLSPEHTQSTAKSTMQMGGRTFTSDLTTDSKWISSACKKK
jgi:hypothetical protein